MDENTDSSGLSIKRIVLRFLGVLAIILVAFVILLSATYVFVLDLGQDGHPAHGPQIATEVSGQETFGYEEGDSIEIYHATGNKLATENIQIEIEDSNGIVVSNFSANNGWTDTVNEGNPVLQTTLDGSVPANDTFGPGDTLEIEVEDDTELENELTPGEEYTIRIMHRPSGGTPGGETIELS